MKFLTKTFLVLLVAACGALQAQDTAEASSEGEAPAIPTEVSEPPYAVGDLIVEQGYYLDRGEDEARINLRLVENQFRLYWIDKDGVIVAPEAEEAIVRLTGSVRVRKLHQLSPLPQGAGLGAPALIFPPHTFNLVLHIPNAPDRPELTHSFRYTPGMDKAADPTTK